MSDWDARFFIAIFPNGEWCKVHAFTGGKSPKKHCLSALEGLDGPAQRVALVGRTSTIERREGEATFDGGHVAGRAIDVTLDARDPFFWIRTPGVLSYFSATGVASVVIDGVRRDAFGILERAWGAETRVDVAKLVPRVWQWDVLTFGDAHDDRFFAGLALHGFGIRGTARLPCGGARSRVTAMRIRDRRFANESGRRIPLRWNGTMRTRDATLRYEARAATPVSPEVSDGGFLGFTWEGDLSGERVSGAGFSEYRAA